MLCGGHIILYTAVEYKQLTKQASPLSAGLAIATSLKHLYHGLQFNCSPWVDIVSR